MCIRDSETTGRERYMALALLSAHYPVDLYSTDVDKRLEKVRYRGYADYYSPVSYTHLDVYKRQMQNI